MYRSGWQHSSRYAATALWLALAICIPAAGSSLTNEAFAGAVFGNGNQGGSGSIIGNGASGSGQNCGTSGAPTEQFNMFGIGLRTPAGGVGPCNLFGGAIDNIGSGSQSASTGTVTATTNSGVSFTGSATAAALDSAAGAFGLNATAAASGASSISETAGMALVDDSGFFLSCPTCAAGEVLHPIYHWTLTVSASQNVGAPPGSFFYVALAMQQMGDNVGALNAVFLNYSYGGGQPGTMSQPLCYNDPTCPVFTMGPGTASGTAIFSYGAPNSGLTLSGAKTATWEERAGLIVGADGATVDPTAVMTGVTWKDASGNTVTGVTLTTSNGVYTDSGFTPSAPEPVTWLLCATGLGAVAVRKLRSGSRRPMPISPRPAP